MLVKDIIKLACNFTENDEIANAIKNNTTLTENQEVVVDMLINCFNLVRNEIAVEYMPVLVRETLNATDFKIMISNFSNPILEIVSVKDAKGRNVKYKKFDDYIMVFANEVDIIYKTMPSALTISQTFLSTIPERVYAYGVAREYYFNQTLFDDAEIWEERFKNSLQILTRKKCEIKMPNRRWI